MNNEKDQASRFMNRMLSDIADVSGDRANAATATALIGNVQNISGDVFFLGEMPPEALVQIIAGRRGRPAA